MKATRLDSQIYQTFLIIIISIMALVWLVNDAQAGKRFASNYSCNNEGKYCVSSGARIIEGHSITRECWEWAYTKTCNYPSKNDCAKHSTCYSLGQRDCLLRDSLGNCINLKKEFSCMRNTTVNIESETVRYDTKAKDGPEGLVCTGVPCIDGNCVDKSYEMDSDMVSSVSQLGALSQGKNTNAGFKLFEGATRHCSKKMADYSNCCRVSQKGWGKNLGSKCTKEEDILSEFRQKNLCIDAGSEKIKNLNIEVGSKHYYCCFGNMLEKTIQVQIRKQLGRGFIKNGNPDCQGLTLEDLHNPKVDFSKMDFSAVAAEIQKKINLPNVSDVGNRVKDSLNSTNTFDEKQPANVKNKAAGVNTKLMDK